ncbi:hypothetical protein PYW07_017087 [Mythimna separata]|uniref:Uncharacterized protein n=1 Tax=Mythimna separata TaxID=271217 RepID=A0AAD7YX21_MYTSE|nr:hypothetical protein PYW07_017087 [Mythimna separata]
MKFLITIALTLALIQLSKSQDDYGDYGDDAELFSYDEAEDRIDDEPKPHYDLKDAPKLFKKFIKDYKKVYKNEKDYNVHYRSFVENLKEINKTIATWSSLFLRTRCQRTPFREQTLRSSF